MSDVLKLVTNKNDLPDVSDEVLDELAYLQEVAKERGAENFMAVMTTKDGAVIYRSTFTDRLATIGAVEFAKTNLSLDQNG